MTLADAPTAAPPAQVFATFIRATPEAIWRALTESEFTTRYYYSSTVDSEWAPGAPYVYRIDGNPAIEGTVEEADAPRRLVLSFHATWDEGVAADPPSRMTWEIEPAGPGVCKVTIVHDRFPSENETYRQVGGGAGYILAGLKTLLETGEPLGGR